jgi:hypothetical protein
MTVTRGSSSILEVEKDFVAKTAVMALQHSLPPEENHHKENKGAMFSELPLHYIHGDEW